MSKTENNSIRTGPALVSPNFSDGIANRHDHTLTHRNVLYSVILSLNFIDYIVIF